MTRSDSLVGDGRRCPLVRQEFLDLEHLVGRSLALEGGHIVVALSVPVGHVDALPGLFALEGAEAIPVATVFCPHLVMCVLAGIVVEGPEPVVAGNVEAESGRLLDELPVLVEGVNAVCV